MWIKELCSINSLLIFLILPFSQSCLGGMFEFSGGKIDLMEFNVFEWFIVNIKIKSFIV